MKTKQNKNIAIFALSILAMIGTYNAVMINSGSHIGDSSDFKRLDEAFGVVKVGRQLAVANDWKKVSKAEVKNEVKEVSQNTGSAASDSVAAIQADLNLKLVEVINPKKWIKGVTADQFNGAIATNNGIIETLNASLPDGLNIEIAFSEMNGNTFEYDLNGEVYAGMMYQIDQGAYMITMTNGPLEGTRMRFAGESKNPESQNDYLAETHNVEVQNFGAEMEAPVAESTESVPAQTAEAASFNFNI